MSAHGASANVPAAGQPWVQAFRDGSREQRDLLGGKGAGIAEMSRVLGEDLVPAGFTITTDACRAYLEGGGEMPHGLEGEVSDALERLEARAGRTFGDRSDPLLVSVRSGARESMPGMMDTVLNLGLNDESVEGLAARTGDERFAWDCYRRLVQMYGNVVLAVPSERFEAVLDDARASAAVASDSGLSVARLRGVVSRFREFVDFPRDPRSQLDGAIRAVFDSWNGDRAVAYRAINGIPDAWGTAVNVQQMVFGNKGDDSASGVAFSRDELTGGPQPSGDFLVNAQGEDVVSGSRTPLHLKELEDLMPDVYSQLLEVLATLERHYGDMQDTEFTVEDGRLYMLQTRSAKRPAQAAVRFAVDAVREGLLDRGRALATIDAGSLEALLHPGFDPAFDYDVVATGVGASPGAASGEIVLTAPEAIAAADEGRDVILVRRFTEADDVAGFHAARGILTSEGGKASHAALVARGMGRPAVTGASAVEVDEEAGEVRVGELVLRRGDRVAINGTTGEVTTDEVPLVDPEISGDFETVLAWCPDFQRMEVRANADSAEEAGIARELGATGIGLCRTEHMFLGERQPLMADVILARGVAEREERLAALQELQQADFTEIFEAMDGLPVTIRLLDPPLHEFLPRPETLAEGELRDRVSALQEVNPMLGLRGVRLGILHPEIYRMQALAIFSALTAIRERAGEAPHLEVMVPLIAFGKEFELARGMLDEVAAGFGLEPGIDYHVGTMIELPRACLCAGEIAQQAEFFSFGTNDLTQTTLGFSRDDIEGRILSGYISSGVLARSPFEEVDAAGVGELVEIAVRRGRATNPRLHLGACGEHAGEPVSIAFFERVGLDYVSCSPYRVPVARVAAAQASLGAR